MCELPSITARIAALWAPHAVGRDYPMSTHAPTPKPSAKLRQSRIPVAVPVGRSAIAQAGC